MTKKELHRFYLSYGALLLIIIFATVQFFLILRHKSPYVSDSYFYKHLFYQFQGDSFEQAYQKIKSQVDLEQKDEITQHIFGDIDSYKSSYSYFSTRPLYPIVSTIINLFIRKEFVALLLPVLLSYLGSIFLVYYLAKIAMKPFWAILTAALFISFYPFLDWSTYFMTDTIGTFFWSIKLFLAYQFLIKRKRKWLFLFLIVFAISLLNRQQNLLMVPLFLLLYLLVGLFKLPHDIKKRVFVILATSFGIAFIYLALFFSFGEKSILDNINYIHNSFGLYSKTYSLGETMSYLANSLENSHLALITDIMRHHWWFVFALLAIIGSFKILFLSKKKELIDLLILSSGVASYLFILWPFFSYRFLFPTVISIIYLSCRFIEGYYQDQQNFKKEY